MTNTAPTITDPGALSLLEGGTTVATISASDAQNNSLSFSIASGDDQELFAITTGGDLSFVSAPDFESPADADTDNVYEVAVQVSDGSLTDTQAPTVSVITLMTSYLEILMKPVSIISTGLRGEKMRYQSVLVLGFLTAIATQAQSASLKTFEAGERVKAAEVNGNFEYLEQKINPLVNDSAPR